MEESFSHYSTVMNKIGLQGWINECYLEEDNIDQNRRYEI